MSREIDQGSQIKSQVNKSIELDLNYPYLPLNSKSISSRIDKHHRGAQITLNWGDFSFAAGDLSHKKSTNAFNGSVTNHC